MEQLLTRLIFLGIRGQSLPGTRCLAPNRIETLSRATRRAPGLVAGGRAGVSLAVRHDEVNVNCGQEG